MRPPLVVACLVALASLVVFGAGALGPRALGDAALQPRAARQANAAGVSASDADARDDPGAPSAPAPRAAGARAAPRGWTARIAGVLVDERTRAPLVHTLVLFPQPADGADPIETDERGQFETSAAHPAGRFRVELRLAGARTDLAWGALVWHHPDSVGAEHPVAAGPQWPLALELDEAARATRVWQARLYLDPEGQPGWPGDPTAEPGFLVSPYALRCVGERGRYTLEALPPAPMELGNVFERAGRWYAVFPPLPHMREARGPFVLEVYGGYVPLAAADGQGAGGGTTELRARAFVATLDGGGAPLRMRPVALGGLALELVDDDGAPLAAEVWLVAEGSRLQPEEQRRARTSNGGCRIVGIPPGRYLVQGRAPGHAPLRVELDVASGVVTAQRFVLPRARRNGRIAGTLTSDSGRADHARAVRVTPLAADEPGTEPAALEVPLVWTDVDGRRVGAYACEALPPGEYAVEVVGGYLQDWAPPIARVHTARGAASFRLADAHAVDVRVRVLEDETGLPLAAARVGVLARRAHRERSFGCTWDAARISSALTVLAAVAPDVHVEVEATARGRARRRLARADFTRQVRADGRVELVAELRLPLDQR